MEETTYRDGDVVKLIREKYIAVHVDADARPDLANRYEDFGWPATIVFNSDGSEIVKRRGYLDPPEMSSMLAAIVADPTPGPSVSPEKPVTYTTQTALAPLLRAILTDRLAANYDAKLGGWGTDQKYLDWDNTEWSLRQAATGDKQADIMARQTLDAQLNLIDPAWGGVYQYSVEGDWNHPHFEKIMQMQAENLRIYSLAYSQYHDAAYLKAAEDIHKYLATFLLGPDGAFFTSQDADLIDGQYGDDYFKLSDADRRAKGIPRIDQHQYARENGWAIKGLVTLYEAAGDKDALSQAITAAQWVIANRSIAGGGFRHDAKDAAGPYLGDTLAMGQAFLSLYTATADRAWLMHAEQAADFIQAHFTSKDFPGLATVAIDASDRSSVSTAAPAATAISGNQEFDENVAAVRWANLLSQYDGRTSDRKLAESAMRYLATPAIASNRMGAIGGILLADREMSSPAIHIAIVGKKSDAVAMQLFATALAIPTTYKRVEWYDAAEGPLPNSDVQYPDLGKAAAFVCTGSACSPPAFTPESLMTRLSRAK
jgi:uncharacterized protein YyaL (SSP411 family)